MSTATQPRGVRAAPVRIVAALVVLVGIVAGWLAMNGPAVEPVAIPIGAREANAAEPADLQSAQEEAGARTSTDRLEGSAPTSPEGSVESASADSILVRTVDEDGMPVAGLEIHLSIGGTESLLGPSDALGERAVELPARVEPEREAFFWVDSADYVGRSNPIAEVATQEAIVTVFPRGRISGVVLLPDGNSAGSGIRVIGYDSRSALPKHLELSEHERSPLRSIAVSDEEGSFQLDGLARGAHYTIEAGGRGLLMKVVKSEVPEGTSDLELSLSYGYAVLVELSGPEGPIQTSSDLWMTGLGTFEDRSGQLERVRQPAHAAVLAGVPRWMNLALQPAAQLAVFASDVAQPWLGPIGFEAALPGYQHVSVDVSARALADGVERVAVEASPASEGFGELEIVLLGAPPRWTPDEPGVPQFFVELGGAQDNFKIRLGDGYSNGSARVSGIPYSRYVLQLSGLPARWPSLSLPREIEVRSPFQKVEIDLGDAAGIELFIERSSGQVHQGYARVTLLYAGPAGAAPSDPTRPRPAVLREFLEPPYFVYPLAPGRYEVGLAYPFDPRAHGGPQTVEVAEGMIEQVLLIEER